MPRHGENYRDDRNRIGRAKSTGGKEIDPPPKCKHPKERKKADGSLRYFLERYFPETFPIEWSPDHLAMIERLEACILGGGQFCSAMPRGSGKTSVTIRASMWALLTGRRRFVVMIGATQKLAEKLIAAVKGEFQFNDLLAADYPEVCHPIRQLENESRRQAGQTIDGENTMMRFAADEIVLPTLPKKYKSKSSGSIIRAGGLTGAIRGHVATGKNGGTIRPDLLLLDDPQDRESAKSPTQTEERERLINGDALGLAGPKKKIAAVMNCTVIYKNDLSDRYLNQDKYPQWHGRRAKLLYEMPKNIELWDRYADIRRQSMRELKNNDLGNEFYRVNRSAMDEGALAGWPARFNEDELSAIQNAMNLRIDVPRAFASEYQNDPEADALAAGAKELDADAIAGRYSGLERLAVPRECGVITTFVDPSSTVLWYLTVAWTQRMGGSVIDYGCWPRQNRSHFAQIDARPALKDVYPGRSAGEMVFAGLRDLFVELLNRRYVQDQTGGELMVSRALVDCGWETDAVYQFVRSLANPRVMPSKGVARSATSRGIAGWKLHPGEVRGHHWRQTISETKRGQMIQFDPDAWKSYAYDLLTKPQGGPVTLTLYGKKGTDHGLLSEHLSAEYSEPVTYQGTTFDKWQLLPARNDNHWFDCLVGAAVAASVEMRAVPAASMDVAVTVPKSQPVSLRALQEQRRREKEQRERRAG